MLKSVVLCCLLAISGGYLIQYLADAGLFRQIEPYGLDRCHLTVPKGGGKADDARWKRFDPIVFV